MPSSFLVSFSLQPETAFFTEQQLLHAELQPIFFTGQLMQLRSGQSEHLSLLDLIESS